MELLAEGVLGVGAHQQAVTMQAGVGVGTPGQIYASDLGDLEAHGWRVTHLSFVLQRLKSGRTSYRHNRGFAEIGEALVVNPCHVRQGFREVKRRLGPRFIPE